MSTRPSRSSRPVRVFAVVLGCCAALAAVMPATDALAVRCAVPDLQQYRDMVRPVSRMVPTHQGDLLTPPPDPGVGDSWLWYTWQLNGYPTPVLRQCTVRGEGQNVYVVVEDSQWGTRVDQTDVDAIIDAWDNHSVGHWPDQGIYQLDTTNFGPCPDELDNDPKVYVLYYDFDINADGFFWYFDEYPDGTQPFASNECEVLYMNSSDNDPGGEYLISVQAHEFQHMIHWLADDNEDNWVNEGMSEMGMWLYGHPDQVVGFPSNPDNSLTNWSGVFADYVKTYLFGLYYYEHFGGQNALYTLVQEPLNSTLGVQQALIDLGYSTTFPELARDWFTANWLDDPSIENGRYNYEGEDLPTFASITKSSYPVPLTGATVNHYAADYVKFVNGQPQRFNFNGGDTSVWTARAITFLGTTPLAVLDIPLNGTDDGSIDLPGFGTDYDQVVLLVGNVSAGGVTSYQYSTEGIPASVEDGSPLADLFLQSAGPNPFSSETALRLVLDRPAAVAASIHSVDGARVRTLASRPMAAGAHVLAWDGRDDAGSALPAGVYFMKVAASGGPEAVRRLVLVR